MKVTVRFDESAALKPSEVKVNQLREAQWAEAERAKRDQAADRYYRAFGEWRGVAIEDALIEAKVIGGAL